ncbi:MAG: TetR/AcrR family transcriptional regulator [Motilibacteraceae bacterium]
MSEAPTAELDDARARRREELLDAADRAVHAIGPGASMVAIAAEAGITKPVLYRHFGDKSGLYRALAERHTGRLMELLREALGGRDTTDVRAATEAVVDAYVGFIAERPATYLFLVRGEAATAPEVRGHVEAFLGGFAAVLAAALRHALALPDDDPDPTPVVWSHAMAGAVQRAGDWWLDHPDVVGRPALVASITDLLHGGFPARAARTGSPTPPSTHPAPQP